MLKEADFLEDPKKEQQLEKEILPSIDELGIPAEDAEKFVGFLIKKSTKIHVPGMVEDGAIKEEPEDIFSRLMVAILTKARILIRGEDDIRLSWEDKQEGVDRYRKKCAYIGVSVQNNAEDGFSVKKDRVRLDLDDPFKTIKSLIACIPDSEDRGIEGLSEYNRKAFTKMIQFMEQEQRDEFKPQSAEDLRASHNTIAGIFPYIKEMDVKSFYKIFRFFGKDYNNSSTDLSTLDEEELCRYGIVYHEKLSEEDLDILEKVGLNEVILTKSTKETRSFKDKVNELNEDFDIKKRQLYKIQKKGGRTDQDIGVINDILRELKLRQAITSYSDVIYIEGIAKHSTANRAFEKKGYFLNRMIGQENRIVKRIDLREKKRKDVEEYLAQKELIAAIPQEIENNLRELEKYVEEDTIQEFALVAEECKEQNDIEGLEMVLEQIRKEIEIGEVLVRNAELIEQNEELTLQLEQANIRIEDLELALRIRSNE